MKLSAKAGYSKADLAAHFYALLSATVVPWKESTSIWLLPVFGSS